MLNMKVDQIAFIAHNDQDERDIKARFNLSEDSWTEDFVLAKGQVRGEDGENFAKLLFNYDQGIEIEILRYLNGPNYASDIPGGHLCHIGMHYSGEGEVPSFGKVIQTVETQTHTNQFLLDTGRHYRYTIYDTRATAGVYLKVIERIETNA